MELNNASADRAGNFFRNGILDFANDDGKPMALAASATYLMDID